MAKSISEVFKMVTTNAVTEAGLVAFADIIGDEKKAGVFTAKHEMAEIISFFEKLWTTETAEARTLFVRSISLDGFMEWATSNGQDCYDWLVSKLEQLAPEEIAQVFSAPAAVHDFRDSDGTDWMLDKFALLNDEQVTQVFSASSAVWGLSLGSKGRAFVRQKLKDLNDSAFAQILSAPYAFSAMLTFHTETQWVLDKIDRLDTRQVVPILAAQHALEGISSAGLIEWGSKKLAEAAELLRNVGLGPAPLVPAAKPEAP